MENVIFDGINKYIEDNSDKIIIYPMVKELSQKLCRNLVQNQEDFKSIISNSIEQYISDAKIKNILNKDFTSQIIKKILNHKLDI